MTPVATEPPSIPAAIQAQLDDIQRLRQNHPMLFREGVDLFFGATQLTLTFPGYTITQAELQAVALAYPDAGWRPKCTTYRSNDLDWHGEIAGIKVVLPRAQTMPFEKLPDRVDLASMVC